MTINRRTRHSVTTYEDDGPSVTVVRKGKKYVTKGKKRYYSSAPSGRVTVVKKRRPGSVVVGGSRTTIRDRSETRFGSSTSTNIKSRSSTSGQSSRARLPASPPGPPARRDQAGRALAVAGPVLRQARPRAARAGLREAGPPAAGLPAAVNGGDRALKERKA